jgi:hypothetical protein
VLVRRSLGSSGPFEIVRLEVSTGSETSLIKSDAALFPVGFTPNAALLYASVSNTGSDLYRATGDGSPPALVAHLSDDLTRDWALSPDGTRLAFLSVPSSGQTAFSRVQVLDVAGGQLITERAAQGSDEFGPSWSPQGTLSFGRLAGGSSMNGVVAGEARLAGPSRGFDVPLAWSTSGSWIAVRSFDGTTVTAPGRPSLTLVNVQGGRKVIATGEVTFIGWTHR